MNPSERVKKFSREDTLLSRTLGLTVDEVSIVLLRSLWWDWFGVKSVVLEIYPRGVNYNESG